MDIQQNLKKLHDRIRRACLNSGRDLQAVRLVAVSKLHPAAMISEAIKAGQLLFGENYVQELTEKAKQVTEPVCWHLIGPLQSNKVKYLPGIASMVHTVDRFHLAEEISHQWGKKRGCSCEILLQLNLSGEETKSGCKIEEVAELAARISRLPFVKIKGLMTIPPFFDNPEDARPFFRQLRLLAAQIERLGLENVEMKELSMGMSNDFEVAIEEGATLVRVGSAIFGER